MMGPSNRVLFDYGIQDTSANYFFDIGMSGEIPETSLTRRGATITTEPDYSLCIRTNSTEPPQFTVGDQKGNDLVLAVPDDDGT